MQNQHPNKEISKQNRTWLWRTGWRHLILIFVVLATLSLLSPLLLRQVLRGEIQPPARTAPFSIHKLHDQSSTQFQKTPEATAEQLAHRVDELLTSQTNSQQFSGSVLVARQGKVLLARGYSRANWETGTANTVNTRFFLASVTKEFTAMAILILQEQGKLRVGDRLCLYIANCPLPWEPLTLHQLLIHTSGIPELDASQLAGDSPEAWIASFASTPLQFTPGGQFQYCSTCYQILAYVVQRASGLPYSQFIQQYILDPLHMQSSGFDANFYYTQPTSANGYQSWQVSAPQLGWQLDPQWSFLSGSGLLYSTVEDLYRWDQALYTNALVSQETLTEAYTPYISATLFPGSSYGYGWFISQSPASSRLIWHNGVIDGFRNYIGRYVNDNVTIIILSNLSTLDSVALAHSIEQIVFA